MQEKMIVIRDPRTFCFNFHWSKDVDDKISTKLNS